MVFQLHVSWRSHGILWFCAGFNDVFDKYMQLQHYNTSCNHSHGQKGLIWSGTIYGCQSLETIYIKYYILFPAHWIFHLALCGLYLRLLTFILSWMIQRGAKVTSLNCCALLARQVHAIFASNSRMWQEILVNSGDFSIIPWNSTLPRWIPFRGEFRWFLSPIPSNSALLPWFPYSSGEFRRLLSNSKISGEFRSF
jgi:hypothetical protein